ncbi:type VI secretion protein IcmF/TssM N-terminal domain-containing protein [Xenorhabdus miraniensis]|uniref:type VI secretion protein IcmF/TssM N-terminal domain-containing protein n=1 Tax=Xenorhabdus miraniensis TaxID=351674 RepID=UPI001FC93B49|nr:type VI secretion protein IcmF/TssM N-terminal domain-containing protein [Xenorhabdus miraniensis]
MLSHSVNPVFVKNAIIFNHNGSMFSTYHHIICQSQQVIRLAFHSQFPPYLIMTETDLLYGFEAMYQSLDRKLRDEILGVTFSLNNCDEKEWRNELELIILKHKGNENNVFYHFMSATPRYTERQYGIFEINKASGETKLIQLADYDEKRAFIVYISICND